MRPEVESAPRGRAVPGQLAEQEARLLEEFARHFSMRFNDLGLLRLALTHRSYLHVTGQGPRDSNERLEFLGDSVLGLVTSDFLYRKNPTEHEGQLTKTKSLLVSKAILSRRALAMGLGRFVFMSHSEVESGGRQRLSIVADAFESVVGAIYLDQGFEAARTWIERFLLRDARVIAADKRHTNYKSHLQEYVQSNFRTHPVYRIRNAMGPDHSKQFLVEVMVGRKVLGEGRGKNKKEAEQAAARDALERVGSPVTRDDGGLAPEPEIVEQRLPREIRSRAAEAPAPARRAVVESEADSEDDVSEDSAEHGGEFARARRRGRRGGRGRRERSVTTELTEASTDASRRATPAPAAALPPAPPVLRTATPVTRVSNRIHVEEEDEEIGRPEGPLEERHVDPFAWEPEVMPERPVAETERAGRPEPIEPMERFDRPQRPERAERPERPGRSRERFTGSGDTSAAPQPVRTSEALPVETRVAEPVLHATPPTEVVARFAPPLEPVMQDAPPVEPASWSTPSAEPESSSALSWREERAAVLAERARAMGAAPLLPSLSEPDTDDDEHAMPASERELEPSMASHASEADEHDARHDDGGAAPTLETGPPAEPTFGRRGRKSTGRR